MKRRRRPHLSIQPQGAAAPHPLDYASPYVGLTQALEKARATVRATTRPLATAADHQRLSALLATCIRQAVAADAAAAPVPAHVRTWMGEAVARSTERELALIAATDSGGVMNPTTAAYGSWPGPPPQTAVVGHRGSSGSTNS